ncbi:hypothetical protein [Streptomyces sp. CBMA156]|uniref:hypothetical protein n=1 Tax=Streptomyces sp. CBMA156 TaxID=1930280 RepID=UPI001661F829|nr:hypothetical protein [Streptomyces sp. CBMA156]MBD0675467.1 hypothetical protein [Streptomyces sp. CBMA156]
MSPLWQHSLAVLLDDLCKSNGLTTFQAIADAAGLNIGAVRRVMTEKSLPAFSVILAIAAACHASRADISALQFCWLRARSDRRPDWYKPDDWYARQGSRAYLPRRNMLKPELIADFAELRRSIKWLLFEAGSPSPRELEKRSGFNVLPHSTLERTLKGERTPGKAEVIALVEALDLPYTDAAVWGDAWDRCGDPLRVRRLTHDALLFAQAIDSLGRTDARIRNSAIGLTASNLISQEVKRHGHSALNPALLSLFLTERSELTQPGD